MKYIVSCVKCTIKIDLVENETKYSITTTFKQSSSGFETLSQKLTPNIKIFPWEKIFVSAYGASRLVEGGLVYDKYSIVESVYSLFNYNIALQHPELAMWRRTEGDKKGIKKICEMVDKILMLNKGSTKLGKDGLTISGNWGDDFPFQTLADGYTSTLTWIMDFIKFAMLAGKNIDDNTFSGIVIVDELEQHLHPKWQQLIISTLHNLFPNIQFFITTHSPLLVMGTTQLQDNSYRLVRLKQSENMGVEIKTYFQRFNGWTASQILGSEIFDWVMPDNSTRQNLFR